MESSGVGFRLCQLATPIFSNPDPPANRLLLLLLQVTKDGVLDHRSSNLSTTDTCRLKHTLANARKSLAPHLQHPPHSNRPPKCGWLTTTIVLLIYTKTPPTHYSSRMRWASGLHGNSPYPHALTNGFSWLQPPPN